MTLRSAGFFLISLAVFLAMPGCGQSPAPPQGSPLEVAVLSVQAGAVPLTRDLVGRLSPVRTADVRARVAGVLLKRIYKEGSDVREGDVLFQIDPERLQAALHAAQAALAQAEASATNAHVLAARYRELAGKAWISKSDLDTADANERSTAAQVKQAQANLEAARINLSYATVRAPIAGRSGQQAVTEGALVGQNDATLLTTIEQINPIYVNFDQPAGEIQQLQQAQSAGDVTLADQSKAHVQLILADGTPYGEVGTLDFSDASVNPATGALALRGQLPNADHRLLPGMFVNVRLTVGQINRAFLVPQMALRRDGNGAFLLVVAKDGKVAQQRVIATTTHGNDWIVTQGLADGDRVIVSAGQQVRVGTAVTAVPYQAPPLAVSAAPPPGS